MNLGLEYEKILSDIYKLYINSPKATKKTSKDLSKEILNILNNYGYKK